METRIKVGVRIRPLSGKEQQEGQDTSSPIWSDASKGRIAVGSDARNRQTFNFDWCYDKTSDSKKIYEEMCKPLVAKVFEGYNATFFACKNF